MNQERPPAQRPEAALIPAAWSRLIVQTHNDRRQPTEVGPFIEQGISEGYSAWPRAPAAGLRDMKLLLGTLATLAIGWGVVLAAPKPVPRKHVSKIAVRKATAEQICKSQGPTCKLPVRPDAPRDFTGAGCVCD
jgi:hypothetical protein